MNLAKLNNQYAFLFESACKTEFTPSKLQEEKLSCTLIPNVTDAFMLEEIKSGFLTDAPPGKSSHLKEAYRGVIIRASIGYAAASRIEDNFGLGCLIISNLINVMLYEASKYKAHTFDKFKLITFQRPGQINSFFQELESSAGYELRLYIEF